MSRRPVHSVVRLGDGPGAAATAQRRFRSDPGRWLPPPAIPIADGHRVRLSMATIVASPDVVVMDIRLRGGNGIDACREIRARRPDTRVLMLTSFTDDQALFDSIMAGAAGYVLKQVRGQELAQSIRRVGRGGSILDPAVTQQVLERIRNPDGDTDEHLARLTPTEQRILDLITDGRTNREIADRIHLAEKTIKNYVSGILSKGEVSRRVDAAAYLAEQRARRQRRH